MRADRLLSMLMLLQARRRLTARQLADELEVSVRTIYRDIDALSFAGIPVYTERGPGGGCSLLDSYRTTLTGLTQDEVRALFMLGIPAAFTDLGVDQELKSALLKLAAALPATRRLDEARARQRVHLDSTGWSEPREYLPHLSTIQKAVWQDHVLHLTYSLPFDAQARWSVEPYGLVAKENTWYLVCHRNDHVHVYHVSRVLEVRLSEETFERPPAFELAAFWDHWCATVEINRPAYSVAVRVSPGWWPYLPRWLGETATAGMAQAAPPDPHGWRSLRLHFDSLEEARGRLLGCGGGVEILSPTALRRSVADCADQIVNLYRS